MTMPSNVRMPIRIVSRETCVPKVSACVMLATHTAARALSAVLKRCCLETRARTTAQLAHARVANVSAPAARQLLLTDVTAFVRHLVAPAARSLTARDLAMVFSPQLLPVPTARVSADLD